MEAIIKADPQRGPGHGIIAIAGAGQIQNPSFVLQRAEDKRSLAANGCWQESASLLKPEAWQVSDGILHLAVGPALVNELDMLGAYRIQLTDAQGNVQACVLTVGQLVYSDMGGGQGIIGAGEEKTDQPAESGNKPGQEENPEAPEPNPEPQPEPPAPEPETMPEPENRPEQTSENEQLASGQDTAGLERLSMEVEPKKPGSGNWQATVIVLAILGLLAWAGWWWLQKSGDDGARPLPPIGQQGKKNPPLPDPRVVGAKTNQGTKTNPDANNGKTNALTLAREHLRGSADPATSLALASPLRTADASPEQADASFLLLEDAAQKGQAEAMYLLAQFYDPVATLPHGSIPIDMEQARHWYARAAEKGISQAGKALKDLQDHALREAQNGNALARRLLREWKQ